MGRYCTVCGEIKGEDGFCHNPQCGKEYREAAPAPKRPIRLTERLKELRNAEQGPKEQPSEAKEAPFFPQETGVPEKDAPLREDETAESEEEWAYHVPWGESEAPPAPVGGESGAASRPTDLQWWRSFPRAHRERGPLSENLRGVLTLMTSVLFTSIGTLLFGFLYLEDFFMPWAVATLVPVAAYGFSFLYGWLFLLLGRGRQRTAPLGTELLKLFRQVTSAGKLPNRLLLLTALLSPLDKTLGIFQFFALLLVLAWIISLLFHITGEYRSYCNGATMLLTLVFALLAFAATRATWVWYLTGEFRFALYIPLNSFF